MRQIKFRGKRLDNGKWVHGFLVNKHYINRGNPYANIWIENHDLIRIDTGTIGQFTGLTDKNGKEIYEGDIVLYESWRHGSVSDIPDFKFTYEIRFTMLRWMCHGVGYCQDAAATLLNNDGCIARRIKVIGNIHDNPELIKQ